MSVNGFENAVSFIRKIEELKNVQRANMVIGGRRRENSAEHSWHVACIAMVLEPFIKEEISFDLNRVIKMLLIHDIVEIEAGDTFLYSDETQTQAIREKIAAENLFGILEGERTKEYLELFEEFEAMNTNDAKVAKAIDNLQPLINYLQVGKVYTDEKPISEAQVRAKKMFIKDVSLTLWELADDCIKKCTELGLYSKY